MNLSDRRRQFETASKNDSLVTRKTKFHKLFGVSNSAKVITGGLQLGVVNLDNVTPDVDGFAFACTMVFPPEDEVYFTAYVRTGTEAMVKRLMGMKQAASANAVTMLPVTAGEDNEALIEITGEDDETLTVLNYSQRNNNTVVVLANDGNFYLRNQGFWDTLPDNRTPFEPAIPVDKIVVAVYPPAASAKRSLLAREFVGYLARFVGREKVHEIQIWDDKLSVSTLMRRMPEELSLPQIRNGIAALGGFYDDNLIDRFHAGLNHLPHKRFVVLSGLSGTGKTLIARQYARTVHGLTSMDTQDPLLFICPVRPEWTDPTGLTGYYDVLSNRYIVPPFLEAVLVATSYKTSPVFVVLDEMNLARVEYYFSDVLSCIESRHDLQLHSSSVPLEASTGGEIPAALPIPSNLFIIGTINVDETTNSLSDKVLDRAVVIDMSMVNLSGFLNDLVNRNPDIAEAAEACGSLLTEINELLISHNLGFGYRLTEEFVRYHAFAAGKLGRASDDVIDEQLVQKALVKLRGTEAQRSMLDKLEKRLAAYKRSTALVKRLSNELEEFGSFQNMR